MPFRVFPGLPHPAPSARELSQLLDGLRLRRLACLVSCRRRPWGFENQTFTCPTGLASGDGRPGRPRAQWQRCRSSTAMPGDQRWSVDRSRASDWNRSRNRASAVRVQAGTLTLDCPADSIHLGGSSPGSSDAEACAPSGDPVSNAAPKHAPDSVRPAAPATEVAASADQRSPPATNPPCRTVRKPPAPRSIPTFAGLRVQGTLPGKHGVESTFPTRDQRLDSPANGVVETARPTRGTAEAITTRRPHSLASEQEQRVRLSTTSPDCE